MARGVDHVRWNHTSALLAAVCNAVRGKHTSPIRPDALHPYKRGGAGGGGVPITEENFDAMRNAIVKGS